MTELEIIKALTMDPLYKGLIQIKSPYLKNIQALTGYYINSEDRGVYFYGPDKIGMGFRTHYNSIIVEDYRGIPRRIIRKTPEGYELRLNSDTLNLEALKPSRNLYLMAIAPGDWNPGDIFQEADDTPMDLETLISIRSDSDTDNPEINKLKVTTLTYYREIEIRTFSTPKELEDQIYTLIPSVVKR